MIEVLATANQAPGVDLLCPIVPAACIVDLPVDIDNPLSSFLEQFFGSSIQDTLGAVGQMVLATPEPNFTGEWFRSIYLEMGISWIGWGIAVMVLALRLSTHGWRGWHRAGAIIQDFVIDLIVVAILPVILNTFQAFAYGLSQFFNVAFKVNDPGFLLKLVPTAYLEVGWMSFLLRGLSLWLMLQLLFISFAFITVTVILGMFFPLRSLGVFGQNFQIRTLRYVLLGLYAKPLMLLIIGVSTLLAPFIETLAFASPQFAAFGLGAFVILACALAPLIVFKATKEQVAGIVIRANSTFEPRSSTGRSTTEQRAARQAEYQQRQDMRAQKRQERNSRIAGAAIAASTGGAAGAVGAATALSPRAARVKRGVEKFRRSDKASSPN